MLGHCYVMQSIAQMPPQQTRDVDPMLVYCWSDVVDGGATLTQHWVNVSCLLGVWINVQAPRGVNVYSFILSAVKTRHGPIVVLMLVHRLRCSLDIVPALGQCLGVHVGAAHNSLPLTF